MSVKQLALYKPPVTPVECGGFFIPGGNTFMWEIKSFQDKFTIRVQWNGLGYLLRYVYDTSEAAEDVVKYLRGPQGFGMVIGEAQDIETNFYPETAPIKIGGPVKSTQNGAHHLRLAVKNDA